MKQYTDWAVVSTSYDPLTLYRLIERTILAQTEYQYPFATVYDQEFSFYSFKQETLSNPHWCERFNTKVDVSEAIGVTRQHKILLDYVAQESYTKSLETMPRNGMSRMLSCNKAEYSMEISKWIFRMTLPQETITIPRIASRHCICWISIARLWSPR
jgi:hypothetical protein